MTRFLKKNIAAALLLAMLANFGFIPAKQARALDVLTPVQTTAAAVTAGSTAVTAAATTTSAVASILTMLKELVLDSVANVIGGMVLKRLEQNIYDWGTGKKSSIRLPFGIEDFNDYFDEFLNIASGKFLDQFKGTQLCKGINVSLGQAPSLALSGVLTSGRNMGRFSATFGRYYQDRPTYQQTAACTLDKVVNNIESFIKRPRISVFGWDAWKALNQPQNNIFGAFYSALDYKTQLEVRELTNASNQAAVSGGYKNQTVTTANSQDSCRLACQAGTGLATCQTGEEIAGTGTLGMACTSSTVCDANQACQGGHCVSTLTTGSSDACESDRAACISNCTRIPFVPLATKVSNLGSSIHESMDKALGADMARIINVSEITQLAGIFFQALFSKAMNGLGLAFNSLKATGNQQNRSTIKDNFSYLKQFTKLGTAQNAKDVRQNIVAGLDQSIKQFDRAIVACSSDQMMTYQDWQKNISDILQSNVEGLYVGIVGVNPQPDMVTLDPPYAPYSVYGYSWGEVFSSKVPEKCRIFLNKLNMTSNSTCSDIISGLEPNFGLTTVSGGRGSGGGVPDPCLIDSSLPQCRQTPYAYDIIPGTNPAQDSPCIPCMYDHDALNCPTTPPTPMPMPPQKYPGEGNTVWTNAMLQQKNNLYASCNEWYVVALNRCDECLKRYDEKCANLNTAEEKNNCIMQNCNNYGESVNPATGEIIASITPHVIDPPTDGLDFYGKCLIEEQKDACFSCLKEYYMPATYCEQMRDYTARLVIKYPAIVVNKYKKDEGEFRGLLDQAIADKGGLCDDNDGTAAQKQISLALICRALPDFAYQGVKVCQTECFRNGMTQAQLLDVTDFRPNEDDCILADGRLNKKPVGGREPFQSIDEGTMAARGTCCADFWQKDRKNYTTCVGAGPTTETGGGTVIPLTLTLAASPASGPAPLNNVSLTATVVGAQTGEYLTYNFDCDGDGTLEKSTTTQQTTYVATNVCNYPINNTTFTATATVMTEAGLTAIATTKIQTSDCAISYMLNPATGIVPVNVNITGKINSAVSGPFTFVFYCNANGNDPSTWSGASIEYVSPTTNEFTLDNACSFDIAQTADVGVTIQTSTSTSASFCHKTINVLPLPQISCSVNVPPMGAGATVDDIVLETNASPNSGFMTAIGTSSGITYQYDCDGNGTYDVSHTANDYSDANTDCNSYFGAPGSINTVNVRVGSTSPSGLSAYGTCQEQVTVPESIVF